MFYLCVLLSVINVTYIAQLCRGFRRSEYYPLCIFKRWGRGEVLGL